MTPREGLLVANEQAAAQQAELLGRRAEISVLRARVRHLEAVRDEAANVADWCYTHHTELPHELTPLVRRLTRTLETLEDQP